MEQTPRCACVFMELCSYPSSVVSKVMTVNLFNESGSTDSGLMKWFSPSSCLACHNPIGPYDNPVILFIVKKYANSGVCLCCSDRGSFSEKIIFLPNTMSWHSCSSLLPVWNESSKHQHANSPNTLWVSFHLSNNLLWFIYFILPENPAEIKISFTRKTWPMLDLHVMLEWNI